MAKSYGSKKQMEKEGPQFKALKSGSYITKLIKAEIRDKKNFDGHMVPTLCLQFAPYEANARTAKIVDVDGGTVKPLSRKLFLDINKVSMGFRENFTIPSKYRALVAALQNMDPNEDVPGPDELTVESAFDQVEEYIGDYLVVNVTVTEKNEKKRNKITDFLPVPDDFEADPVIEAQLEDAEKKRAEKPKDNASDDDEEDDEELEEDDASTAEEKPKAKKNTRKALF